MSDSDFTDAVRSNVPLLISIAGGTGSGKTYSAMELATGLAGGKANKFAVIDTENGRALHYAPKPGQPVTDDGVFNFAHRNIRAPFRPSVYADAIRQADEKGFPVIVVDSGSHEHAGEGGLLDWHEEEHQRMGGKEGAKMAAWIKPKMAHKEFVQQLLQVKAHIIFCFRAEQKIEMIKDPETRKTQIVPKSSLVGLDGWIPVAEKNLPYEMTCSFLMTAANPGFPLPIKLQQQHRKMFPLDRPIGQKTGELLAAWSRGESAPVANLAAVIAAIKVAETPEQLRALGVRAAELADEDKPAAKDAYRKRADELANAPR